jgi:hypothetical protein
MSFMDWELDAAAQRALDQALAEWYAEWRAEQAAQAAAERAAAERAARLVARHPAVHHLRQRAWHAGAPRAAHAPTLRQRPRRQRTRRAA